MPCTRCGADNRATAQFCAHCGAPLGDIATVPAQPVPEAPVVATNGADRRRRRERWLLAGATILTITALALAGVAVARMGGSKSSHKAVTDSTGESGPPTTHARTTTTRVGSTSSTSTSIS